MRLGLRGLVLVVLIHLIGLLSRFLLILFLSTIEACCCPRFLHVLSRELVLLINDPLAFLLLVFNHGLLVDLLKMLFDFEELLLEPRVWIDYGPPLSCVSECIKHRQTQFLHQIGDDHRGTAGYTSVTTVLVRSLITSGPRFSLQHEWRL